MSGPALKQLQFHRAIHDAAHAEAEEMTGILRQCVRDGALEAAVATAALLVEHWHTRTLRHAAAEEEGLYREIVANDPGRAEDIAKLMRQHDHMRQLVSEVEERLPASALESEAAGNVYRMSRNRIHEILVRLEALVQLVEHHSREEERCLFGLD